MVKIRLKRFGGKNEAHWRVVVADAKSPRDGRFIEEIGSYNARPKEEKLSVKQDRLEYWVKRGAQVSAGLRSLLKKAKKKAPKAAA